MTHLASFERYWRDWKAKVASPALRNNSKLHFPDKLEAVVSDEGKTHFLRPEHPICIWNAPQKSSSGKRGQSHRQAIFIDGSFTIQGLGVAPNMVLGTCNITIFEVREVNFPNIELSLVDAMHFDMEPINAPKLYHPAFHVQRGTTNTLTDQRIKELVSVFTHKNLNDILVKQEAHIGTPHLRLPTPQMDIFSVLTMVIADFFCNGGDKDPKVQTEFASILKYLTHQNNVAREGVIAAALRQRSIGFSSFAHWYSI